MHIDSIHVSAPSTACSQPIAMSLVPAGFPSPADDYMEGDLDLNAYLIRHPAATFFVRVSGDSMIGAGVHSGDLLIVDRAEEAVDNSVVIARLEGDLTVKRFRRREGGICLVPENPDFDPIEVGPEDEFEVWGVVTTVIHPVRVTIKDRINV
jgi:DNA polymerase V